MSSMRRLDTEKLRTRRIIATATLTVFMIVFLLLRETSAAQFPSDPVQAEQMPAGQTPREAAAQHQAPNDSAGNDNLQTASTARPARPQEQ